MPITSHGDREVLDRLYNQNGLSLSQMSVVLGMSSSTILRDMDRLELSRRRQGLPLRYTVNTSFFDKWSFKMAWALGVFMTDGCLFSESRYLSLSSTDLDLVENISAAIGSDYPIRVHKRLGKKDCHEVKVCARGMEQRLKELGIIERKTKTLAFPDVPGEFLSHFVRGLWDGDGSLRHDPHYGSGASFGCASYKFIQDLLVSLPSVITDEIAIRSRPDKEFWQFSVHGDRCRGLVRWMYSGSSEETRMNRKYEIAQSISDRI